MLTSIIKWWKPLILLVGVVSFTWGVYALGQGDSDRKWQLKWSQRDLDAVMNRAKLDSEYRAIERELRDQLAQQVQEHDQRLVEVQRDQYAAANDALRLREQLEVLRKRLTGAVAGDPGNPSPVPSATAAAAMLTELYAGCVGDRSILAAAADDAHRRGLEVEKMYDRARGQ